MPRIARLPESSIESLGRSLQRYATGGQPYGDERFQRDVPAVIEIERKLDGLIEAAVAARVRTKNGTDREMASARRKIRRLLGYTYP